MRFTSFFAAGLVAAGLPAIFRQIQRRHRWEQHNRQVHLCLYFEQASVAATRAGQPLYDFLHDCRHHGATHVALLEDTLDGLLQSGDLTPAASDLPGLHRFTSARPALLARLRAEFEARFPHLVVESAPETLVLKGNLAALRPLGLGFDPETFRFARSTGLQLIARPVSYPWPTPETIERTLSGAAELGAEIIAFAHDPLLGHEMHLADTAASLRRHNLVTTYFPDSRHQRGDWFIAKTAPERTLLALRYTPADLDREDEASLAYRASLRALEGGIRLLFVDADIGVHASTPTAIFRYLDELVHALVHHGGFSLDLPEHQHELEAEDQGPEVRDREPEGHTHEHEQGHGHSHSHEQVAAATMPDWLPLAKVQGLITNWLEQPAVGYTVPHVNASPDAGNTPELLAPALGLGLLAAGRLLPLPLPLAIGLAGGGYILAVNLLPRLDQPRDALERTYAPSYSAKLLALGALALGPAGGPASLLAAPAAGMLAAAVTAQPDYALRIEGLRLNHLDWTLPLAVQIAVSPPPILAGNRRWVAALTLLALPTLLHSRLPGDPIDALDREHPAGHTHHLSAAQRSLGDARMALSPQPLHKWAGLSLLWLAYSRLPAGSTPHALAGLAATAGAIATAGALRQPSRPISLSLAQTARSWALMTPVATAAALIAWGRTRRSSP